MILFHQLIEELSKKKKISAKEVFDKHGIIVNGSSGSQLQRRYSIENVPVCKQEACPISRIPKKKIKKIFINKCSHFYDEKALYHTIEQKLHAIMQINKKGTSDSPFDLVNESMFISNEQQIQDIMHLQQAVNKCQNEWNTDTKMQKIYQQLAPQIGRCHFANCQVLIDHEMLMEVIKHYKPSI